MYLLNRLRGSVPIRCCVFTFHYVSIKSSNMHMPYAQALNLHSTMYLLNLVVTYFYQVVTKFTFHYVSIKSKTAVSGKT